MDSHPTARHVLKRKVNMSSSEQSRYNIGGNLENQTNPRFQMEVSSAARTIDMLKDPGPKRNRKDSAMEELRDVKPSVLSLTQDCSFASGHAAKIIGATDAGGELIFLVEWANTGKTELITARRANEQIPHAVISFYQGRIVWDTDEHTS